jgi:hypothetical protein
VEALLSVGEKKKNRAKSRVVEKAENKNKCKHFTTNLLCLLPVSRQQPTDETIKRQSVESWKLSTQSKTFFPFFLHAASKN